MSDYLVATILGIVEGLTEFLPISSTGHMLLVNAWLGIDDTLPRWRVFLFVSQTGAIAAVVLYFWRDLWRRIFHPPTPDWRDHLLTKLFAAMVPTGVLGLLLDDFMEAHLLNAPTVAIGLLVGAVLIEWIDRRYRRSGEMTLADVTLTQSFLIGLCQCLAMVPGVSRSGASIMGGMTLGLTPTVAAQFSFYLAIPTLSAAALKQLIDYRDDLTTASLGMIAVGTVVSFVVALGVVAGFMRYVQRRRFTPFAVYRAVLGVVVLAWWWSGSGN